MGTKKNRKRPPKKASLCKLSTVRMARMLMLTWERLTVHRDRQV